MTKPAPTDVYVDMLLTDFSIGHFQPDENYAFNRVFQRVGVQQQTGQYDVYEKADLLRDEMKRMGDTDESQGAGYGLSQSTYSCDAWGVHKQVGAHVKANTQAPADWRQDAVRFVTQLAKTRAEKEFATDYMNTSSVWGTDFTPGALWSDTVGSDPFGDIATGKETVLTASGFKPNIMCMSYAVWSKLKNHPDIVDRVKYGATPGAPALVTQQALAALFELDEIIISMAVENTADEGAAASMSPIVGKHALLAYRAPSPSLYSPASGYMVAWEGLLGSGSEIAIREIDMPVRNNSTRIEAQLAVDFVVSAADTAYRFASVVA